MYAQDYDEVTCLTLYGPDNCGWPYTFEPYIMNDQVLTCPSDPGIAVAYAQPYQWGYYHMYTRSTTSAYGGGVPLAKLKYPAELCAFGECISDAKNCGTFNTTGQYGYVKWAPDRHNEGMNCGMVDGHAKWYSKSFLEAEMAKGTSSRFFSDAT